MLSEYDDSPCQFQTYLLSSGIFSDGIIFGREIDIASGYREK